MRHQVPTYFITYTPYAFAPYTYLNNIKSSYTSKLPYIKAFRKGLYRII